MQANSVDVFSIFIIMWIVSIVCYVLHPVSFYTINDRSLSVLFLACLVSVASYYLPYKIFSFYAPSLQAGYRVRQLYFSEVIRSIASFCIILVYVSILIYNYCHFGHTPLATELHQHVSQYSYKSYGRGKNYLFYMPIIVSLFFIYKGHIKFALILLFFQSCVCVLYLSRGSMIEAWSYCFFGVYLKYRNHFSLRHMVMSVIVGFTCICLFMSLLGSIRTGDSTFLSGMNVVEGWKKVPVGIVWVIVYVSAPVSNAIDFFINGFHEPFFSVTHELWMNSHLANPKNTAMSYLGACYLHFGTIGVICLNILYGSISGIFYRKYQCEKSFLNFSLLVFCCVCSLFIFFFQYLISYKMLVIVCLLVLFDFFIVKDKGGISANEMGGRYG